MATSIVQILAAAISYFAARGIDAIIGKWIAYLVVAWEASASKAAREQFRLTKGKLFQNLPEKWKEWDSWRKNRQNK